MRSDARALVEDARKAVEVGRRELESGDVEMGADRACVAMLRVASACLAVDGLAPSDPGAICIAYGQRFSRTSRLYSAYHRWLLDAMDLRKAVTGDLPTKVDAAAAETALERADLFRDAVLRFLDRKA